MKNSISFFNKQIKFVLLIIVLTISFYGAIARASITPTISLYETNSSTGQITVNADPNSNVLLHYGNSASLISNIGTTDQNGSLIISLNSSNYNISCGNTAYAIVNGLQSATITWAFNDQSCNSSSITFSQSNITLSVGQSQSVTIYSSGSSTYYISNNLSPSNVTASINGNTLNLYGLAFGGSTITVCQSTGGCGIVYVVIINNSQNTTTQSNILPLVSSVSVSLNNISNGQFKSPNNLLTLNFSTNEPVVSPSVLIAGKQISVSGNNSGPYTATYTMTGNESSLPVLISFSSLSGNSGSTSFYLADKMPTIEIPIDTSSQVSVPVSKKITTNKTKKVTFNTNLKLGSSGTEVRNLQTKLKALKLYTGKISGKFDANTEKAVKAFQKAHKLKQLGSVGPNTRALLNK